MANASCYQANVALLLSVKQEKWWVTGVYSLSNNQCDKYTSETAEKVYSKLTDECDYSDTDVQIEYSYTCQSLATIYLIEYKLNTHFRRLYYILWQLMDVVKFRQH